jgi:hypothetical protein
MTAYYRTKLGPRLIPFFKEIVIKTSVFLGSADDGEPLSVSAAIHINGPD